MHSITGLRAALLAALVALALSACDGGSPEPQRLSREERALAGQAQSEIRDYCREVGRFLTRRSGPPTTAAQQAALESTNALVSVARGKPNAEYAPGQTMRNLLADTAEDLEGINCSTVLVQRLDEALSTLPPP